MHPWIWNINVHIYTYVHKYTHVGQLNFEIIYDTLCIYIGKLYSFRLFCSFISFKRWLIILMLEINPGPCAYQVWAPPWSFGPRFISPSFFLSVGKYSLSGVIMALPVRLHSDKAWTQFVSFLKSCSFPECNLVFIHLVVIFWVFNFIKKEWQDLFWNVSLPVRIWAQLRESSFRSFARSAR